jgi:eukaryotic translation initiation factor 2-alpha kinase 4
LRPPNNDKWYPLDIKVKCEPQRGSNLNEIFCSCFLRVQAPKNYPKVSPKIYIEDPKGLSSTDVASLISQLNKEAYSLRGEVCIFELCQFVQTFLHQINQSIRINPPKGSFYDQMLARKLDEKKEKEEEDQKMRQRIEDERFKRKELLKKETRTRRSTINDSPLRHLSSESSNSECKTVEVCEEHKKSDTIVLPLEGNKKKIMQGACLGHSLKGCINYSGIDYATGKLYYITEWNIKHSSLEARNLKVSEFIDTVHMKVQTLIKLHHRNIVSYEGVLCNPEKESVQVYLIQEFILGISLCSMSGGCFNWNVESVSAMTKGVLEGLIFLHNNGVSHGNLSDSAVFLDSSGTIKISVRFLHLNRIYFLI